MDTDIDNIIIWLEGLAGAPEGAGIAANADRFQEAAQALRGLREANKKLFATIEEMMLDEDGYGGELTSAKADNEKLRAVYEAAQRTAKECAEMEYDHTCCCWNWTMLENSQHQCGLCELREALAAIGDDK